MVNIRKKKTRLILVFLLFFLFIPLVQAHTITVPTNAYFGFGSGSYINFNTEKTFDNVYRENNYWYFDGYGFQVQNANMTITDYFSNPDILSLTVSAPSNTTSTTKIYVGSKGKPYTVKFNSVNYTEGDKWSYNSADSTLTLTWLHSSDVNIVIDWQSSPPPPSPPNGISGQLRDSAIAAASFLGIIFILGMIHMVLTGKDILYAVILAISCVVTLLVILVLSQMPVFTGV